MYLVYSPRMHQYKTMNHPSKESFLQWYQEAPRASMDWLLVSFEKSKTHSQYTLLSSFLARCISGKYGNEGEHAQALSWADKAMGLLDDTEALKKAYGGDVDYVASLQACVVLKVRWLSLSEDHFHWYKAKDLCEDMLATGFPSIYVKGNTSKDGIFLALMLMGVYNRLGEHTKAMALGTRIQSQAQSHNDAATECRASFNWAVATLLLAKQHSVENKSSDAQAALDSAAPVLNTLCANAEMRALLGVFVDAVAGYVALLQKDKTLTSDDVAAFANRLDVESQWGLLDIVQMHSNTTDESLSEIFVRNLEDASAGF